MSASVFSRALLLVGALGLAGCPDPVDVDPDPDAGMVLDAGPTPDAGPTSNVRRVRAVGLGPGGGTAAGPDHRITGEIGRPTSSGRSSGPDHSIVGGVGRPAPRP